MIQFNILRSKKFMFPCKNRFQNYIKIVGQSYFDFHNARNFQQKRGFIIKIDKLQDKHEVKLEII